MQGRLSAAVCGRCGRGAREAHGHRPRGPRRLQGKALGRSARCETAPLLRSPRPGSRAVTSRVGVGTGSRSSGTPCTAGLGSPRTRVPLQDTTPDELLSAVMTAVLRDVNLSPTQLGDICVGELATQALRWVLFAVLSRQNAPQAPPCAPGTCQVSPRGAISRSGIYVFRARFRPRLRALACPSNHILHSKYGRKQRAQVTDIPTPGCLTPWETRRL